MQAQPFQHLIEVVRTQQAVHSQSLSSPPWSLCSGVWIDALKVATGTIKVVAIA